MRNVKGERKGDKENEKSRGTTGRGEDTEKREIKTGRERIRSGNENRIDILRRREGEVEEEVERYEEGDERDETERERAR